MAGIQGSGVLLVTLLAVLGMVMVGQTSAASATPESFTSCMEYCPGYRCPSEAPHYSLICLGTCTAVCAMLPVAADTNHYCMVGCTTSSFSALSTNTNSAAEAIKGTINRCSNICNAAAAVPSK